MAGPRPARARARCCSSSSASTTTSTTSARSAPASASRPARWRSPRSRSARSGSTRGSTGHRFLFGTVAVGARRARARRSERPTPRAAALRELRADAARGVARARVRRLGAGAARRRRRRSTRDGRRCASAPSARPRARPACATTPATTARGSPTTASRPPRPRAPTGDVAARLQLRAAELEATCDVLDDLLAGPVAPGRRRDRARRRAALGVGRVESPRGATLCAVELDGGRDRRACACAPAPTPTGPRVAHAAAGNLLPDFPLINKSFELCYACVDR